ncbi:tRNA (guanine-N(7)-)-methyltransferase [Labeo rohita]|uniref:tRNA (Guanine-N(7)-)-methyltransferase n=1 Tax=Labeo rohita TaxID=84645 RepID=A0ABQ8L0W3_LABRO|nr:tRNA (guanine-N(7)-)-methyltransferase [Labeo rohita]
MDDPAVLVLLLEQGDRSFEDHTTDFVFLANCTNYPDNCLCSFYFAGLNTTTRAQLSGEGPRESLATYVEWVLVSCNSSLTVDFTDDDTSPTLDPEPSQPGTESQSPARPTSHRQVREPATMHAREEVTVERKDAKEGPTHCTSSEGELGQSSFCHRLRTPLLWLRLVASSHWLQSNRLLIHHQLILRKLD